MSDFFDAVNLTEDRRVEFDVSDRGGSAVLAVQLHQKGVRVDEVVLPYPSEGLAGASLLASPSGRLTLLSIFSGQSEEGYELFRIGEGITRVAGLSYQFGEAASYAFSSDEKLLVMALPFIGSEWWLPWDDEETEPNGEGRLLFGFGQISVHEVESGEISTHELKVSAAEDWEPERTEYDPDLKPQFLTGPRLGLSMPWGAVELPFPPSPRHRAIP